MIKHKAILKYSLPAGLGLALACGSFFYLNTQIKNPTDLISRLDFIQTQLETLSNEAKKPVEIVDLTPINQDFNKLTTLIEQLKNNDETTHKQLINEYRTELTQKLDALNEIVKSLEKKHHPVTYLPITALPFKIISIDSIQQISVATVAYDFKTLALEKSDKLAGWKVLSIDFGQQWMELENGNKEHVIVRIETEQGESNA